jgi:gliding motility-associated-like protein
VGTYNFTVFDSLYCTVPHTEVINAPDSISSDSLIVLPVSCYGDSDGEIRTYARGGTPPYTYILNPGTDTSLTGIFSGLLPGSYTVSILDAQSCAPYTSPILTVGEPPQFRFDSSRVSSISCGGFDDGSIEIFASGGVPPYEYSVDTGASYDTASVITGLGPGTYIIVVRDSSSCTLTGDTVVLTDPPGISLDNVNVTDVAGCAGDSSGALLFEASGGTGPLEYSIDSLLWQPGGSFTGLPAGDYTGRVRDSLSCLVSFPQETILEPPAISALITTTTAMIPDSGSITISASGGIPPFEYSIDSGTVFSSDTFYRVPSDLYRIVVRDANGCTYEETVFVSATPPLEVNVSSTGIKCFGDTTGSITLAHVNGIGTVEYSIDGGFTAEQTGEFTRLTGGNYFIQVTDSHRIFRDTVILFEPPPFDVTGTITPATCSRNSFDGSIGLSVRGATPPYTYLWSNGDTTKDLTGLEEMIYSLEILDSRGCRFTSEFEVTATVTLIADAGPDTVVCFGDQVMLNGSGGDEFTWSPEAGLDRIDVSNPVATVTDSVFYVLFTRELTEGCADRDTVFLSVHPDRGISTGKDTTVATGQTITLSATGGPFSAYQWLPVEGLENPAAQSTQATITTEISYTVTGTTEFGCSESDSMNILIATGLTIYSGFTPNGDGTNDFWDIDDIIFYPNATVKVFDRWGRLVFSSVGYADDQRWDGKYQGKDLPTGTYYYIIDLKDGSEPYKGPVTIVR